MPYELFFGAPLDHTEPVAEGIHDYHYGVGARSLGRTSSQTHASLDSLSYSTSVPVRGPLRKRGSLGSFLSAESQSAVSRSKISPHFGEEHKYSYSSFLFAAPTSATSVPASCRDLSNHQILTNAFGPGAIDFRCQPASKAAFTDGEEEHVDCMGCCNEIGSCVTPDFHPGKSECCFKCGGCLLASKGMTPDWQERLNHSHISGPEHIPMGSEQGRPGEGEMGDQFKAIKTRNKGKRTGIFGAIGMVIGAWLGRVGGKFKALMKGAFQTGGTGGAGGVRDAMAAQNQAMAGGLAAQNSSAQHSMIQANRILKAPFKRINRKFGRFMDKAAGAIHSALSGLAALFRRKGPNPIWQLKYDGELGLLVEYQSPTVAHTNIGDSESWTCQAWQKSSAGNFGKAMPKEKLSGFQKVKRLLKLKIRAMMGFGNPKRPAINLPPDDREYPVYGTGLLEPIPDLSHPEVTFREPQHLVHVHLEDANTGLVHWDGSYNLGGSRYLTKKQRAVLGEQPDFIPFCPPLDDPPHVYHMFLSKTSSSPTPETKDFLGKVIVRAYEADGHDPEDFEFEGGLLSRKQKAAKKRATGGKKGLL